MTAQENGHAHFQKSRALLAWRLSMSHPGSISIRIAAAIAILFFAPAWNSPLHSGASRAKQPATNVPDVANSSNTANKTIASNRLASNYGKLPISFEMNQGQTDRAVQFLARGAGYTLFLTPGEAVLSLHATAADRTKSGAVVGPHKLPSSSAGKAALATPPSTVRLQLIGANIAARAEGLDPLPGKSNYFVGNDPAKWHTDVSTYAKVRYTNVYPGIDLLYYGNQEGKLEHDFVVAPGADPNLIAIRLSGSDDAVSEQDSGLALHTPSGNLALLSPTVYQEIDGQRRIIPATYLLADNKIKFQLGSYDKAQPLVIDPVIQYTGVVGGSGGEGVYSIALDKSGNLYMTGYTSSRDFPVVNALEPSWTQDDGHPTSFVAKINAAGTALLYSTYLGGSRTSTSGIAVDSSGRAYIVGTSAGAGTIPVKNAFQPNSNGDSSAFLTVLGAPGNTLVYSTYLGGSGGADGRAIALDTFGNAYITGMTSPGFPTLHSVPIRGGAGVFAAKFGTSGALQYSSVVDFKPGNPTWIDSLAIAVDATGAAYIAGMYNPDQPFPVTPNAYNYPSCTPTMNDDYTCVFVVKFNPSGSSLAYASVLGHGGLGGNSIAVDSSGNAYIAGTATVGFPVYKSSFQPGLPGAGHGFVTKLNASGSNLLASTYLGGNVTDDIFGLALDQYRQVYVVGSTYSSNFPVKASLAPFVGGVVGFVTTLSPLLNSVVYYSTLLDSTLFPQAIAVDRSLNVYIAGSAAGNIPVTPGALNKRGGLQEVFVSKLVIADDLALGISGSSSSVAHGSNFTYTIAVTSKGPDFGVNVHIDDTLPVGTTFVSDFPSGGTCTAPAVGATGSLHCTVPQLNKGQTYTVKLTVHVNAVAGTTLSNTATTVSSMQDLVSSNNKGTLTIKVL
jgi:uncharacterized repeat protein (TIGR01451 family)